jgi:hypothetical protein
VTRERLVELSTRQRAALVAAAGPLVEKARAVDRVVQYVRLNPGLTAALVGAVALLGPRKLFNMAARALTLFALIRR